MKKTKTKSCRKSESWKLNQFVVFVDGMDGDVCENYNSMTWAVDTAFKNGAKKVTIKQW